MSDSATSANDAALSIALFHYSMKHKRDYKSLTVMGLSGANHGESISAKSCSDAIFSKGLPTFDWPIAPLPEMKYPYAQNSIVNAQEEDRCI